MATLAAELDCPVIDQTRGEAGPRRAAAMQVLAEKTWIARGPLGYLLTVTTTVLPSSRTGGGIRPQD